MAGAGPSDADLQAFINAQQQQGSREFAEHLRAHLNALTAEVTALQIANAAPQIPAAAGAQPEQQDAAQPALDPELNVPLLRSNGDIAYDEVNNPVRRLIWERVGDCRKLKLFHDERHSILSTGSAALRHEYEHWAPVVSWLHDGLAALDLQARAADIPQQRRESLAVVGAWLRSAYAYALKVVDVLVMRADIKNLSPAAVAALEDTIMGSAGSNMASAEGTALMEQYRAAQVQQLAKATAKEAAAAMARGGDRKPEASK